MIFSLVLPTINRKKELNIFLDSIAGQKSEKFTLTEVEVVVVDQNGDQRLDDLLNSYGSHFPLQHLRITPKGLSNARNAGIALAKGRFVAFPDDDCFYAPDTLEKVLGFFKGTDGKAGLFIRGVDPTTKEDFLRYPKSEKIIRSPGDPDVFLGISISQFYPMAAVRAVGDFDERFGIGGIWGSGEETDYSIRVLENGYSIHFRPDITVFHEKMNPLALKNMPVDKVKAYSMGFGALCRKHGFGALLAFKTLKQMTGVILFALKFDFQRAQMCWITTKGRITGFLEYDKKITPRNK
jgi:glycosyltransferase involved in cell wall biosynthesis